MKNKINYFSAPFLFILFFFLSCSTSLQRNPSSLLVSNEWEKLRELKQKKVELSALSVHYEKKNNKKEKIEILKNEEKKIDEEIKEIESRLLTLEDSEKHFILNSGKDWRIEKEKIELMQLSLYEIEKNVKFSVSTYESKETTVTLTHKLFSSANYEQFGDEEKPVMDFRVKCDAPFEVKYGLTTKKIPAQSELKFSLGDKKISNDYRHFIFHSDMSSCDFNFISSVDSKRKSYGFKMVNETLKLKPLEKILSTTEVCTLGKNTNNFFETTEFSNLTCPSKFESITNLPEPIDSLNARVQALLGKDLPADFIKNGNPFAELDFSNAPKLDAILVSYLVFRADFYGTLLARLLAYHADQGALVRIIVSDVITLKKDEALYEKLTAQHSNIKIVKYRFDTSAKGGAWISELHRTNHVKLFVIYSKSNPRDSSVIIGGKNIHDGFVFKTPVDVRAFPEVVNYKGGDESWAYWRDFEMVIKGQSFVEDVVRHFMNFYHINKENLVAKISNVAVAKNEIKERPEGELRHYISIPFKDEPNLNLFYARMIDSAQKKILISSPYFRPVKEIAEALDRAVLRGVEINIITRLDLAGDTADFILGAVNKEGVNRFFEKIKVYEYTEPSVILHSKFLLVDEKFSFISSVNLNKRSFFHDLENGVIVNDKKFTMKMEELYGEYLKISKQLTEKQKIIFWKKWIITIFDKVL